MDRRIRLVPLEQIRFDHLFHPHRFKFLRHIKSWGEFVYYLGLIMTSCIIG